MPRDLFNIYGIILVLSCLGCHLENVAPCQNQLLVPEGLKAELWAESPMFYNPTALDVDSRGRIWVTEAVNYRNFKDRGPNVLSHPEGDRVIILEDTDGDGKADQSRVFVQDSDLQSPVGIAVIGNQVIVSSAPHLIIYTDEDGDDVPDHKEILLTGFGGYDHDHSLHSVVAGPDGLWYVNTGNAGPHIVTDRSGWTLRSGSVYNGGTPYNNTNQPGLVSDDGRVWTGGLALKMNSDGTGLRVVAHNFRNAYELTVDSYRDIWQNDNDDEVSACRTTWVMENGNAGFFSADGSRTWRADKRPDQNIFTAHWHQDDPGVMPAGDNTGAGAPTGMVRYESSLLGPEYLGMLLSADAGRNEVFGYRPRLQGAGFDLSDRIRFASSVRETTKNYRWSAVDQDTTKWFRPSDVAVGTDGAIYIADWYDPIVGGHAMHDSTGYGRIYRISPADQSLTCPQLDFSDVEDQIEAFLNPAIHVRHTAFNILKSQGEAIIDRVKKIVSQSSNPFHQARAIWLLANLGITGQREVITLLDHHQREIRLVAFRALRQTTEENLWLEQAARMARDEDAAIRREVALSLRDIPLDHCQSILMELIRGYDGEDRWYLEALGTASEGKESELYRILKQKAGPDPVTWSVSMANLAWRLHPLEAASDLEARASSEILTIDQRILALTALAFIPHEGAASSMLRIAEREKQGRVFDMAQYWLQHRSSNDWAGFYLVPERDNEIDPQIQNRRKELLASEPGSLERYECMRSLSKDPQGGRIMIELAASNWLSTEEKDEVSTWIFANPDPMVRILAEEFFEIPEEKAGYQITDIIPLKGDKISGRQKFDQACATCHAYGNRGAQIGPELSGIAAKMDRRTLLDAILYPDADIVFGYEPWKITLQDGSQHIGFIQGEGDYLLLRTASGSLLQLPASDISGKEKMQSLMPDPVVLGLGHQDVADIVQFLLDGEIPIRDEIGHALE